MTRQALGLTENAQTNCYRLVHGEGDLLPGLIIDIYGSTAVIQAHTVGMYLSRQTIAKALKVIFLLKQKQLYRRRLWTCAKEQRNTVRKTRCM
jgi:23S rRNA (cytosine1962-C5)-methyltransferase